MDSASFLDVGPEKTNYHHGRSHFDYQLLLTAVLVLYIVDWWYPQVLIFRDPSTYYLTSSTQHST